VYKLCTGCTVGKCIQGMRDIAVGVVMSGQERTRPLQLTAGRFAPDRGMAPDGHPDKLTIPMAHDNSKVIIKLQVTF